MRSGPPSSSPNDSLAEVCPPPRRPRRLTFGTSGHGDAHPTDSGRGQAESTPSAPKPPPAQHAGRGAGLLRPAGPLAYAAATLIVALVSLLALKQWLASPGQVPGAGGGQAVRMLPVTGDSVESQSGSARSPTAPPPTAPPPIAPPAKTEVSASSGPMGDGSKPSSAGNDFLVAQAQPDRPAPDEAESARPPDSSSTSSLPADSPPRSTAPSGPSVRPPDKASPAGAARVQSSRPAPDACRGASGLALAQCRECARLDVLQRGFCNERMRLAYCAGRYGRTADCPTPAVAMPN